METTYQFKEFLTYNKLKKFIPLFEEHQISDEEFVQLTKDDILKIVQKVGPIFKIEKIVKYMASGSGFQSFWLFCICFAICYFSCWSWYFGWFKEFSSKPWVKKCQELFQDIKCGKFRSLKAYLIEFTEAHWLLFKMMLMGISTSIRRSTATATNNDQKPPLSNYQKLLTVLQTCTTVLQILQNQKSALSKNEKFQSVKAFLIGFTRAIWSKYFTIQRTTTKKCQNPKPLPSNQKSALPQNQKYPATNQKSSVSTVNPNPPVVSSLKPSVLQNLKPAALPQNQNYPASYQKPSVLQNLNPATLPQNLKISDINKSLQAKEYLAALILKYKEERLLGKFPEQNNKISVLKPSPLPAQKETLEEPSKKKDPVKKSPQIVQNIKSKDAQEQKSQFEHQISDEKPSKKKDHVKEKPSQIVQKVKSKDAQVQKSKLGLEPEIPSKMETRSGKKAEPRLSLKKKKENLDPKLEKKQNRKNLQKKSAENTSS